MTCRYSMLIRWSEEDQVFVVTLPEFGDYAQTHGDTYEKAAKAGREVLDLLIESCQDQGQPLPTPRFYEPAPALQKLLSIEEVAQEKE
ncbi:MAG TPA: type II toxin-antitoxin system HicB family antitoxin [Gemmataceae bacterium]|nr:type II toxin-antitoxin system HicB family antitoxin [Gemmataceae bacterium]